MKYSLVSREVIADSIETVVGCEGMDGLVAIGGCDKNMPGALMAMARLNRPAVFVYGGTILPGCITGDTRKLDIVSVFEAVGAHANKKIDDAQLQQIEACAIPGPGSCGGMYTANTMASAIEALGMSLPNSSAQNAISKAKKDDCQRAGAAVLRFAPTRHAAARHHDARAPLRTPSPWSSRWAVRPTPCLHLLAMAHAAGVKLSLDDFTRIGKRVPVLADFKPSGQHLMSELVAIGGIQPLMKMLLDAGLLHGDCLTVTGKTMAENLADVQPYPPGQEIIRPLDNPIKKDSHLVILYGNLAPEGAVAKITGKEGTRFEGTARVFNSEEQALAKILDGTIKAGDVIVIRYEGPQGRAGHARNAGADQRHHGQGPGQGRRADHRRPLLRRHARLRGRPHHAGGLRRRPAGAGAETATEL